MTAIAVGLSLRHRSLSCVAPERVCAADEAIAARAGGAHADGVTIAHAATPTMPHRSLCLSRGGFLSALSLALLASPLPSRSEVLYTLNTQCSLRGAAPVACTVEAVNQSGVTLYRHRIGSQIATVRITDKPIRMALWDDSAKQWRNLNRASARFSTNTVCFNGEELCVVNPNYLNSVREDNLAAAAGRDLVRVNFGADGRINASCYDDGCEVRLQ